ncbi:MAG: hypothetical protein CMD88_01290 [Gammaproteobacteria bacterium]|nr:hypothetical protein [Gammaproteobacteria bacterium]|tara:strand:- start:1356 stop:1754 length:399 start_codon:yes stop_codon:yes gene_type:complete
MTIYKKVGKLKKIIVIFYDFLLLFSILYFVTIPVLFFTGGNAVIDNILYKVYILFIIVLYYSWFWVNHQQTLGMKAWKVFIVSDVNNLAITYKQALIRLLISMLGGHLFWLINTKSLQDIVSKTQLVQKDLL